MQQNPLRPPLLTLDITSPKKKKVDFVQEEIANPSGNMGMNPSGQAAGKDHAPRSEGLSRREIALSAVAVLYILRRGRAVATLYTFTLAVA